MKLLLRIGIILSFALLGSKQYGMIYPLTPLVAAITNQNAPSLYNFNISMENSIPANSFIRIKFPSYATLTPIACYILVNMDAD